MINLERKMESDRLKHAISSINTYMSYPSGKLCPTAEIAIEAIEKKVPKTPNYEGDGYSDGVLVYDTWICPCCGKEYEVDCDDYKYCPECGQAIDWSEEE